MSSEVPWREAASIIIAARVTLKELVGNNLGKVLASSVKRMSRSDYHLLMVKRSNISSYLANAFVFPGGLVEADDFSPKWYDVFEAAGVSRLELEEFASSVKGPRPKMISSSLSSKKARDRDGNADLLPPDIALRISAIRETFEETGVMLLTRPREKLQPNELYSQLDISTWQKQIHANSLSFIELCLQHCVCPDIWSLHEWWDWLTPTSVGHRRYDTMFYICCLDRQPPVALDNNEVVTMKWYTPQEILEEHSNHAMFMAPPQVYELSRIMQITNFQNLKKHTKEREEKGVEQWLPVLATCKDGALSLLPGDAMYPKKPDYLGKYPGPDFPYSLEELRKKCLAIHRMEIRGPICTVFSSIPAVCDHVQPATYKTQTVHQSYL